MAAFIHHSMKWIINKWNERALRTDKTVHQYIIDERWKSVSWMKKHLFNIYSPPEIVFSAFTSHRHTRRTVERKNVNSSAHLRLRTQPNIVNDYETIISNHWDGPPTLVSTQFAVFGLIEIMSYPIFPSDPLSSSPAALDSIYIGSIFTLHNIHAFYFISYSSNKLPHWRQCFVRRTA